ANTTSGIKRGGAPTRIFPRCSQRELQAKSVQPRQKRSSNWSDIFCGEVNPLGVRVAIELRRANTIMKNVFCLTALCCTLFAVHQSWAGTEADGGSASLAATEKTEEAVPLDFFQINSGYVFESDLNHGGSFGKQSELQNEFEYGHRIRLTGNLYLH